MTRKHNNVKTVDKKIDPQTSQSTVAVMKITRNVFL